MPEHVTWKKKPNQNLLEKSGSVLAIGHFDGVHLGHQALIKQVVQRAQEKKAASLIIMIDPNPRHYFSPSTSRKPITSIEERIEWINALGVDDVACLTFDESLAQQTPQAFIDNILLHTCHMTHWVLGYDTRFGKAREGGLDWLNTHKASAPWTFESSTVRMDADKQIISSTRLRQAIESGDLAAYKALTERALVYQGTVVQGEQRGRLLGFPTANIPMDANLIHCEGVYTAWVTVSGDKKPYPAVLNLGRRPTFNEASPLLEAHLLDQSIDLYGQTLTVTLLNFMRASQPYPNINALIQAIQQDAAQARTYFENLKKGP